MLIKIFKKYFPKEYKEIIKSSARLIPKLINKFFIERRQKTRPGILDYPKTVQLLQKVENGDIADYFLQALLMTIKPEIISTTVGFVRAQAFTELKFLLNVMLLETFINSGSPAVTANVKKAYIKFFDEFLAVSSEKTIPTMEFFEKYLLKKNYNKLVIATLVNAFVGFSVSNEALAKINIFEKKINYLILGFYEELESFDIFVVRSLKVTEYSYKRPFILFKNEILEEIKVVNQLQTREQSWPSLVPLND
jgi:hypothetical protein